MIMARYIPGHGCRKSTIRARSTPGFCPKQALDHEQQSNFNWMLPLASGGHQETRYATAPIAKDVIKTTNVLFRERQYIIEYINHLLTLRYASIRVPSS